MKRLMIGLLGALALSTAQAAQAPAQDSRAQSEATAQATQQEAGKPPVDERTCVRSTGSRIHPRANDRSRGCLAVNGRSYTRDDLDRTGEIDIADALRKLDPSIH